MDEEPVPIFQDIARSYPPGSDDENPIPTVVTASRRTVQQCGTTSERHLYNRENFKLQRSAALAEWRQLAIRDLPTTGLCKSTRFRLTTPQRALLGTG